MTLRANGSYIGPRDSAVSTTAASGVWDLRTAQRYQLEAAWPTIGLDPATIAGLQLWLDAADSSTLYDATTGGSLVAADGTVARWEDKSGNNRHATEATNGPQRKTAVQGGLDVLRFDGSNDKLSIPSSTAMFKFLHSAESTIFVLCKLGTAADYGDVMSVIGTSSGASADVGFLIFLDDRTALSRSNRARTLISNGVGGNYVANFGSSDDMVTLNEYALLSFVLDFTSAVASERVKFRFNSGTEVADNTQTNTASNSNASGDLTIGIPANTLFGNLEGDIAEIIIYDSALSDTDREAVESYLMTKWGIEPPPVPQTISGLQLWLDASDSSTLYDATTGGSLVAADGTVKRWEDKSGNNRHATESTHGPQRKAAAQGGLDTLYFDGTDDKLVVVGSASAMKWMHSADATFFVVTRPGTTANPDALLNILDTNAGSASRVGFRLAMDDRSSGGQNDALNFWISSGGNHVLNTYTNNALTPNEYQLISVASQPEDATANNRVAYYVNSSSVATNNANTGVVSSSDSTYDLHIGGRGTLSAFLNGNIAEVLIYDTALSDADREAVENYLLAKWGIA